MTTYNQNVASNVCGDLPKTIPVNIDCSLCAIGFPQAGGAIGLSFYGPKCLPTESPSPSYWLGSSMKMAQWKCPNPGQNAEPAANTWVATGFFGGATVDGCSNNYRFDATLTALSAYRISLSVSVKVLAQTVGGWSWQNYMSWSETLTEIVNGDTTRYRGRNFSSPNYIAVTPASVGGIGDPVSYVKTTVGMQSMRLGCGSKGFALPICGFWDGTQWLTCIRGFIKSTGNDSIREFTQLGFDTAGCGSVGGTYCGCDKFTLTSLSPPSTAPSTPEQNADPQFVIDYGVLGVPGEAVGVEQQIQIGSATDCGIQVVVKQIGFGGPIYICTNDNGAGWVVSTATVSQAKGPRILTATRTGFDVYLYALNFPNDNLLADECSSGGAYPTPNPETDPFWCTESAGCVQSPLQPIDATDGPFTTLMECEAACAAATLANILKWGTGDGDSIKYDDGSSDYVLWDDPVPAPSTISSINHDSGEFDRILYGDSVDDVLLWEGDLPPSTENAIQYDIGVYDRLQYTDNIDDLILFDDTAFMMFNPMGDEVEDDRYGGVAVAESPVAKMIAQKRSRYALPCANLGPSLEESASCGCGGAVLHECKIHGKCRRYGYASDAMICSICDDYKA